MYLNTVHYVHEYMSTLGEYLEEVWGEDEYVLLSLTSWRV